MTSPPDNGKGRDGAGPRNRTGKETPSRAAGKPVVLALDLGTGSVRACLVSLDGRIVARNGVQIRAHAPDEAPLGREYRPEQLREALAGAVRGAMASAPDAKLVAITADGTRPAFAMLDRHANPLHIGANLDLRGLVESLNLLAHHRDLLHHTTGQLPPTLQWSSRIAWFRAHHPEVLKAAAHFTGLEGWALSLFGVEPAIDFACASGTGLFDLSRCEWSSDILAIIQMDENRLPRVLPAGTVLGTARGDFARALSCEGVPVCLGTGDTHAALAGCGGWEAGETAVVAGTTMAIVRTVSDPGPRSPRLWSTRHMREGYGMVESQCWEAGLAWEWLAATLGVGISGLDALAAQAPPATVVAHFGTAPVDFADPPVMRTGGMLLPLPVSDAGAGNATIARAALEAAAWAVAEALSWLDADTSGMGAVRVTGGMTRSPLWLECVAGALGRPILVTQEDSASVGLAAGAAAGAGLLADPRELIDASLALAHQVSADETISTAMQAGHARWREAVARLEQGCVRVSAMLGPTPGDPEG